jgi:hypothetical protein
VASDTRAKYVFHKMTLLTVAIDLVGCPRVQFGGCVQLRSRCRMSAPREIYYQTWSLDQSDRVNFSKSMTGASSHSQPGLDSSLQRVAKGGITINISAF